MTKTYYRPEWTCGRYDSEHKVAIVYNLIEGMSYFFEDYSSVVIGEILVVGRNGEITIEDISQHTGINEESLKPFFEQLIGASLLTDTKPTLKGIKNYRTEVSNYRRLQSQTIIKTTKEKLPMVVSTAEMDYMNKSGGITSVMFELTYNCSEKCVHCYNIGATRNNEEVSRRGDLQELSLQDYKRVIDELYEQGLIKVCLSGGDPFSKTFAWDIISYLYEKEIATDIYTNGQRIVKYVDRLANYYPRLVGVSLYSGVAEVHDGITRIKGSWEKSMSVIQQLSELAVTTEIKCCIMQPNVKSYYMVADIAKECGAVAQFEVGVTDSIEGDKCVSKYLRLTPEQLEIVLRDDNVPLYVGKEVPNYGGQPRNMTENACGAGYNTFCITPNGDLIPCCAFHLSFGNIKEQSVSDIFNTSKLLKWWNNLSLEQYEDCGKHEYCNYCNLCTGNNYSENHTPLQAGENNCYLAKVRYELACKLKDGNDPLKGKSVVGALAELQDYFPKTLKRVFNA